MKLKSIFFNLFVILTFLISCERENQQLETAKIPDAVDLYLFGTENNQITYWKNSLKVNLNGGNGVSADFFGVDHGNVFMCGLLSPVLNNAHYEYFYWINNDKKSLNELLQVPIHKKITVTDFIIKDNIIHTVGVLYDENGDQGEKYQYFYWKNDQATLIDQDNYLNNFPKISLIEDDIYISGNFTSQHGYYKNGNFIALQNVRSEYFFEHQNQIYYVGYDYLKNVYFYQNVESSDKIVLPSSNFTIFSDYGNLHLMDGGKYYINSLSNVVFSIENTDIGNISGLDIYQDHEFYIYSYDSSETYQKVFINDIEFFATNSTQILNGIIVEEK